MIVMSILIHYEITLYILVSFDITFSLELDDCFLIEPALRYIQSHSCALLPRCVFSSWTETMLVEMTFFRPYYCIS